MKSRASNSQLREHGLESCTGMSAVRFLDSGGCKHTNSLCALIVAWLNASQVN